MSQDQLSPPAPPETTRPAAFVCLRIDYARTARLFVAGELDIATLPQLDQALRQAEADASLVVLDLRRLDFVASCGVRLLLGADARIRRAGGRLHIAHAPAQLHRILELIGAGNALQFATQPGTSVQTFSQ